MQIILHVYLQQAHGQSSCNLSSAYVLSWNFTEVDTWGRGEGGKPNLSPQKEDFHLNEYLCRG